MNKLDSSKHILKNNKTLIIREAEVADAKQLRATVKEYVEESEFIPYEKDEFKMTDEEEANWITSLTKSSNSILLVAEVEKSIIGNITLAGSSRNMMKHTAYLGLGLLKEWRALGIGTLLFNEAIGWAKKNPEIEILWLEAYPTNTGGIKLYKKFGFEEIGRHPNFVKISETEYVDNLIMSLKLK